MKIIPLRNYSFYGYRDAFENTLLLLCRNTNLKMQNKTIVYLLKMLGVSRVGRGSASVFSTIWL